MTRSIQLWNPGLIVRLPAFARNEFTAAGTGFTAGHQSERESHEEQEADFFHVWILTRAEVSASEGIRPGEIGRAHV